MVLPSMCAEGEVACDDGPKMGTLWHILVRLPGGRIEDPSKKLGMEGSA